MSNPAPVVHPLGPPTLSGNSITVDTALNQPTRITRMISDLSLQRFLLADIFSSAGGVNGGAVIFDTVQENELWASRDVERVAPGAEFPVVTTERLAPSVAEVEKWGGKVWITDEARERNDVSQFTNQIRRLTNTIIRKLNQRAIEVLEASISASSQTFAGRNWSTVVTGGSSQSTANLWPVRDFINAQLLAEQDELGIEYDLLLLNPVDYANLVIVYGATLREMLAETGMRIRTSMRVTSGTGYFIASGQVGDIRLEKPLGTETWREPNRERTWVQASVRPVMYVINPFAVLKVTGLAG